MTVDFTSHENAIAVTHPCPPGAMWVKWFITGHMKSPQIGIRGREQNWLVFVDEHGLHLEDEVPLKVLCAGIEAFQVGHEAPCDVDEGSMDGEWVVEDFAGNYVVGYTDDGARQFADADAEAVNKAAELARAERRGES